MRHDPAFKRYFSLSMVVEDLLRAFAARDWIESLDFSTLTDASSEFIDETLLARCADMVWRVCFRDGILADGTRHYLFVLLEFQSSVEVDHVVELRHGGADVAANLQALCRRCHAHKTARVRRAFQPLGFERMEWDEFIQNMTETST